MNEMTHQDALDELAVEQYLLDELQGEPRDRFEAHLFDCTVCAADLKSGLLFVEAAREELKAGSSAKAAQPLTTPFAAARSWWASLLQPLVLAPALAASLAVVVYQSAVLLPRMESQLALAETPSVVNALTLANAGARGEGTTAEVTAPQHGAYLLAVDLPPSPGATAYRCTLYDPSGKAVWHTDVPAEQEKDTVRIQVPTAATGPGANRLVVQSLAHDGTLTNLVSYKYNLRVTTF